MTIYEEHRIEKFGIINNDKLILNELGVIVKSRWLEIPVHYNNINLDQYTTMPNHIHGIIIINNPTGHSNNYLHIMPMVIKLNQ